MDTKWYWFGLSVVLFSVLFSCKQEPDRSKLNYGPNVVEAKGYLVPKDSILPPKVLPREMPIIVPAIINIVTASTPKEHPVDSFRPHYTVIPEVFTPGEDGVLLPKVVPAKGKKISAGLPRVVPAEEVKAADPNPNNFSSFNKIEGLGNSVIQFFCEDKNGNLWIASGEGGVTKYDGQYLTTYTQAEGLCNNGIEEIVEDHEGNLWFASWGGGMSKFDGESFTNFSFNEGLGSNYIAGIIFDKKSHLWATTLYGGIFKYDGETFTHYDENSGMESGYIDCVLEDKKGNLWFGTNVAGLVKFDGKSFHHFKINDVFPIVWIADLLEDYHGNIWIATKGAGIIKYDGTSFTNYTENDGLPNNFIHNLEQDINGDLWMSAFNSGITQYDGKAFKTYRVLDGLENNSVESVLEDRNGNLWFGDFGGGVSKLSPHKFDDIISLGDLSANDISTVTGDQRGNLWLSSYSLGVLRYDGEKYSQITDKDLGNETSVNTILEDSSGDFWFGTQMKGLIKFDGKTITHYPEMREGTRDRVLYIFEDSKGNLWLGTEFGGVVKFEGHNDPDTEERFVQYTVNEGLSHNMVTGIEEDNDGNMWFATYNGGATRYDGKNFTHFGVEEGLGSDKILSIEKDRYGNLWFGTLGNGVSKYDGQNFIHFTDEQGLGSNTVKSILEDIKGNLWFNTDNGLSKLNTTNLADISNQKTSGASREHVWLFSTYGFKDGFFGIGTNYGKTLYQSEIGTIWVGARDRLTVFHPDDLKKDMLPPKIQLTHLALFNETIDWAELARKKDTSLILRNGTNLTNFQLDSASKWHNVPQNLSLRHTNNTLTFQYVGITLNAPHKIKYQYQLEGFDAYWNAPTTASQATYGNLPWGDYTFKVKAMNGDGFWSGTVSYPFTIRAPWWHTWWAYLGYVLLLGGSVMALYRFQLQQKLKKAERLRLLEMDTFKTRLYTNITHEFRTPLTVILGMAQQIGERPKTNLKEGLNMIVRNGQNLLSLINQMLDLSKLESGKLTLNYQQGDIIPFLRYLVESFHSLAEDKAIKVHFRTEVKALKMDFDATRLQQIVSNLLSNAIKFTPKDGHCYITASVKDDHFNIQIKDTGVGIAQADLPQIFDRFYQVDDSRTRHGEGTGIGLALTHELIKLLEGTIAVESRLGEGSVFTIRLPIRTRSPIYVDTKVSDPAENLADTMDDFLDGHVPTSVVFEEEMMSDHHGSAKPLVLVADDNKDVRAYIASCLKREYTVKMATNGRECEETAFAIVPDLIILDVMMPHKDGFEVCSTLKADERTSHIPVIMLTAKTDLESKLEGLQQKADDYLTKPFHKKELLLRIKNLVELRRLLQQYYLTSLEQGFSTTRPQNLGQKNKRIPEAFDSSTITTKVKRTSRETVPFTNSVDNAFVNKVKKAIEVHMDDANFDVEQLCREVALSHSQVHRKLSALTGLSITNFIRYLRLLKAKELLLGSGFKISAIAMDCGFSDPAYFSRVFKKEFGVTPHKWRERHTV